jgi:type 1 glutamine amidotransferase
MDVSDHRINNEAVIDTLVVTGGHPFEPDPFFAVFDSYADIRWTASDRPRTGRPGTDLDVVVFYDMPGLLFTGGEPPVDVVATPAEVRRTFEGLTDEGVGLVFLHHSIASWPHDDWFAEMVGGRFHYRPGRLRGVDYPDSGYLFDVTHEIEVIEPTHPVCAGVSDGFTLTDELYCFPVFEDSVLPLMRTTFPADDHRHFHSADLAIRGRMNEAHGWSHPAGSRLVAWARAVGRSPLVYLQFGDGPTTYADPAFRRVLHDAIAWSASPEAHEWVRTTNPNG